jgi:hypothetical protein
MLFMRGSKALGQKNLDGLADQLVLRVSEKTLDLSVHELDAAVGARDYNGIGHCVQELKGLVRIV